MLPVSSRRANQRAYEIGYGTERSHARVNPAGKPRGNFLKHPTIAIGIAEQSSRAVSAALRIGTTGGSIRSDMEDFVDLDASLNKRISGGFNVGNNQVISLGRTRRRCGEPFAELHGAS